MKRVSKQARIGFIAVAALGVAWASAYLVFAKEKQPYVVAQLPPGLALPGAPAPVSALPAVPGAPGAAPAPSGEEPPIHKGTAQLPSRPDPLRPFLPPPIRIKPIPPSPDEVKKPIPPAVLQRGGIRPFVRPEATVAETERRVAGIMWNGHPSAILVSEGGDSFVVKPGDKVDESRIVAISRDAVYIQDAKGRRWEVKLRGTLPGSAGTASETRALPGQGSL